MSYKNVYDAELTYILDILVVVLGKQRFDRFAQFIDNDGENEFSQIVAKKNSEINPEQYACNICKCEPCLCYPEVE